MPRSSKSDRAEAIERLRQILPPGSTVNCILRHVSRSGMQRVIALKAIAADLERGPYLRDITYDAALAIGFRMHPRYDGLVVGGCGMDMGFHVVYVLARTLYPDGFDCIGDARERRCPSNDHSNGDRDYAPHRHSDGGYALTHRWI